jgi:hypothetical protein
VSIQRPSSRSKNKPINKPLEAERLYRLDIGKAINVPNNGLAEYVLPTHSKVYDLHEWLVTPFATENIYINSLSDVEAKTFKC